MAMEDVIQAYDEYKVAKMSGGTVLNWAKVRLQNILLGNAEAIVEAAGKVAELNGQIDELRQEIEMLNGELEKADKRGDELEKKLAGGKKG